MRATWLLTAAMLAGVGAEAWADVPARLGLPASPSEDGPAPVVAPAVILPPLATPPEPSLLPPEPDLILPVPSHAPPRVPAGYSRISGKDQPGAGYESPPVFLSPTPGTMPGPYPGAVPGYAMPGYTPGAAGMMMPRGGCADGLCFAGVTPAVHSTGPCGPIETSLSPDSCEFSDRPFLENLSIFFGLEGSRQPADLGINGLFGYRIHLNWGLPIIEDWGLGLHLGAGYNSSNNTAELMEALVGTSNREQIFTTIGIFQRTEGGLTWEFAWDYRHDMYYESISTSQWRGLVSHSIGASNEVGVWGAWRNQSESAGIGTSVFTLRPINQVNLFWKHCWDNQIVTGVWVGMAEEHGRLFGPHAQHPFVFGGDMFVPLSAKLALWAEANFITPNDSGVVTATFGFAWFPAGRAPQQVGGRFAPPLPVANNSNFSLDLQP